jgi:hypothetical protein
MKHFIAFLALFVLNIPLSHSAAVIDIVETGGDVQATLTGNINLLAMSGFLTSIFSSWDGHQGLDGAVAFTEGLTDTYDIDVGAWTAFGTGSPSLWDASSGDAFAMRTGDNPLLGLPSGYEGGTLSATATMNSTTFVSLGFTPGTYVTTLTNGAVSDTVTINVGPTSPTAFYTVGGSVSGLTGSVTLQNNVGDDIIKTTNDGFTFTAQAEGSDYAVTVSSQPTGQTCTVTNGSGTLAGADITDVVITCVYEIIFSGSFED